MCETGEVHALPFCHHVPPLSARAPGVSGLPKALIRSRTIFATSSDHLRPHSPRAVGHANPCRYPSGGGVSASRSFCGAYGRADEGVSRRVSGSVHAGDIRAVHRYWYRCVPAVERIAEGRCDYQVMPRCVLRQRSSLSWRRERDIPEQSGACSSFRLAQPLLCNCMFFERGLVGCVDRALRRRYTSGWAAGNSLGADEFGDHRVVIAANDALAELPECRVPPAAIERESRDHLSHDDTEARPAQTAAQTPRDKSSNPPADVLLICLSAARCTGRADGRVRCRRSEGVAKYRRANAHSRSMCSSRRLGANLRRYLSPRAHPNYAFVGKMSNNSSKVCHQWLLFLDILRESNFRKFYSKLNRI